MDSRIQRDMLHQEAQKRLNLAYALQQEQGMGQQQLSQEVDLEVGLDIHRGCRLDQHLWCHLEEQVRQDMEWLRRVQTPWR